MSDTGIERITPASLQAAGYKIDAIIARLGLAIVEDYSVIESAVDAAIASQSKAASDFLAGNERAIGALIGRVLQTAKGADPAIVREKLIFALTHRKRLG